MQFVVHHDTGGANSYSVCKWGREGYDTGLCQILLPKVGVPWQFSEIDSVAYHCGSSADYDHDGDADNYNRTGPGLEVERFQGEPLSADQEHWLGEIGRWLESEWGIPNVQYRGAPLTNADDFHGHVNHRDLHPNPDGLSVPEWDEIAGSAPAPTAAPEETDDMNILIGKITAPAAIGGTIPVPANTPIALLVQGNAVVGSWAEPNAAFGVPSGAVAWKNASGSRSKIDLIIVEPAMLDTVIRFHNKLVA